MDHLYDPNAHPLVDSAAVAMFEGANRKMAKRRKKADRKNLTAAPFNTS